MKKLILLALLFTSCTLPTIEMCGIVGAEQRYKVYDIGKKMSDCYLQISDEWVRVECELLEVAVIGEIMCVEGPIDAFN